MILSQINRSGGIVGIEIDCYIPCKQSQSHSLTRTPTLMVSLLPNTDSYLKPPGPMWGSVSCPRTLKYMGAKGGGPNLESSNQRSALWLPPHVHCCQYRRFYSKFNSLIFFLFLLELRLQPFGCAKDSSEMFVGTAGNNKLNRLNVK